MKTKTEIINALARFDDDYRIKLENFNEEQLNIIANSSRYLETRSFDIEDLKKQIHNDLSIFREREFLSKIYSKPKNGDWILYNEEYTRLKIPHFYSASNPKIHFGSASFYLMKDGDVEQSSGDFFKGTMGKDLFMEDLEFTGEYKKGDCWIFSQGEPKGNGRVNYQIDFKVWKYNKLSHSFKNDNEVQNKN